MKKIIFFLFCWSHLSLLNAQQWEWARKMDNHTYANFLRLFPCGHSGFYVTGNYTDSLWIDGHTLYRDTNMRHPGSPELSGFLGKFDTNGQCLWLKNTFYSFDACPDAAGNIYLSGFFSGQFILDGNILNTTRDYATAIAKISSSGTLLNLEKVDGIGRCEMELNSANQLIVATGVQDSLIYKGTVFKDSTGLVLKLDSSLTLLHASQSNAYSVVVQLELDMKDSIYLVAHKSYPCMYCVDCKIIKYSPSLEFLIDYFHSGGVTSHYYNDPYIVSHTDGNLYIIKPRTYGDATVMKYNTQLQKLWTKKPVWRGNVISNNNKLFLIGETTGMYCGDSVIKSSIVIELDTSLNCLAYKALPLENILTGPGPFFRDGFADEFNNIYVTGLTDKTTNFDSTTITGATGNRAVFIAKLKFDGVPDAVKSYAAEEMISVYPNPSSGVFTINFNTQITEAKISVYGVLGNCISTKVCKNVMTDHLDLGCEIKGIYFMEIISGDERLVKKMVLH
ncbi:MAG: T9SS type A sorting domain-containing protein [Bacteroidota bacterium]